MKTQIEFTRINNDVNGNPRYVIHFTNIVNENDRQQAINLQENTRPFAFSTSHLYDIAIKKANKIGGKKYHTKSYGGGIVFQSYNLDNLETAILEQKNK